MTDIPLPSPQDEATPDFDSYPPLRHFLRDSGLPGIQYMHCYALNVVEAQKPERGRWSPIGGVPHYTIKGVPTVLMGRGRRIPGARSSAGRPVVFIDPKLDELTGLGPPKEEPDGLPEQTREADIPERPTEGLGSEAGGRKTSSRNKGPSPSGS